MSDSKKITWAIKYNHEKYGDVQLRLGEDSEGKLILYTTSLCDGVQHGSYLEGVDVDILSDKSNDEINRLAEDHFTRVSDVFTMKESGYEEGWFDIFIVETMGSILVNYLPHDSKIVLTAFDDKDHSFWSVDIIEENLYDLGLKEYEERFDDLFKNMSHETVSKLLKKGLREEGWIL